VWKPVTNGLSEPTGTIISILAANPKVAAEFCAINNRGIFCSTDSGNSWKMLDGIAWPKEYISQHPRALVVREIRKVVVYYICMLTGLSIIDNNNIGYY